MTTTIVFNGSKWNGEEQDTVEDLLRVLGEETLAPSFDGDFVRRVEFNVAKHHGVDPARAFHISGNFFTRSHAFSIFTRRRRGLRRAPRGYQEERRRGRVPRRARGVPGGRSEEEGGGERLHRAP